MKKAGSWMIEGLYGGPLICTRVTGFVLFWDWESGEIVRRIVVETKNVGLFFLSMVLSTNSPLAGLLVRDGIACSHHCQ